MKRYSNDFRCPICGEQVYIQTGQEGFFCDKHGLIPPIPKSLITLEEVYTELNQLRSEVAELREKVDSHECQCSKKADTQGDC